MNFKETQPDQLNWEDFYCVFAAKVLTLEITTSLAGNVHEVVTLTRHFYPDKMWHSAYTRCKLFSVAVAGSKAARAAKVGSE